MYEEPRNQLQEDAYRFNNPDFDVNALVISIDEENLSCANIADKLFERIDK